MIVVLNITSLTFIALFDHLLCFYSLNPKSFVFFVLLPYILRHWNMLVASLNNVSFWDKILVVHCLKLGKKQ